MDANQRIYRAVENDFTKTVKPEWFNQSGVAEMESATYMTFNDHAVLGLSSETVWYAENTGWTDFLLYDKKLNEE